MLPVCRPFRDHSVSPWRIMKTRGVVIVACDSGGCGFGGSIGGAVGG